MLRSWSRLLRKYPIELENYLIPNAENTSSRTQ
jgi:hypothetical protein